MAAGSGSIRLKREPNYWEVRAYAGRDATTSKHRYVSRTVKGGKRDAQRLLTKLTAELDSHGPTTRNTVSELLTAHVDPTLGKTPLDRATVKTIDDYYNRLGHLGLAPGSILRSAYKPAIARSPVHSTLDQDPALRRSSEGR
jgi:hypothetical protein